MAWRAGSYEPPARGGVCRAPACPRRLRGSRTQPWRGEERGSAGDSFSISPLLFALCHWALPPLG